MTKLAIETSRLSKYTRIRGIYKGQDNTLDAIYIDNYELPINSRLSDELEELNPSKGDLMSLIWLGQEFVLDNRFYTPSD